MGWGKIKGREEGEEGSHGGDGHAGGDLIGSFEGIWGLKLGKEGRVLEFWREGF